jgi:hypothetical protein
MMPFKVRMDNNATVTCGGQEGGKTDMEQFTELSALRVLGFKKYCMKHLPKCEGCNNDTCCDGHYRSRFNIATRQTLLFLRFASRKRR